MLLRFAGSVKATGVTITVTKRKVFPIVEIHWLDAEGDSSWVSEAEVAAQQVGRPVVTVGFLARRPSRGFPMYVVAATATVADEETGEIHFNQTMKIPKFWVKEFKIINEEYLVWQQSSLVPVPSGS